MSLVDRRSHPFALLFDLSMDHQLFLPTPRSAAP